LITLAEEEKQAAKKTTPLESTITRKAGKHERMRKLAAQYVAPQPIVDFLAMGD